MIGIRLRVSHDEAGDTAIALILLCPDPRMAQALAARLRPAGIGAEVMYEPDVVDLHMAPYWRPILEERSWSDHTPWSEQTGEFSYGPERWSRTIDYLSRALHLDISPDLTDEQSAAIAAELRDALATS